METAKKPKQDWSKLVRKREIIMIGVAALIVVLLMLLLSTCAGPTTGPLGGAGASIFQKQVNDAFAIGNPYKGGSKDE